MGGLVQAACPATCGLCSCHVGDVLGSATFCTSDCKCDAGQGACSGDNVCRGPLECISGAGEAYGLGSIAVCSKQCGPVPSIGAGTVDTDALGALAGGRATIACDRGYSLSPGNASFICTDEGAWAPLSGLGLPLAAPPTCELIRCGALAPEAAVRLSTDEDSFGTVVSVTCAAGYRLEGSRLLSCTASGTWSQDLPTCVPLDCGPLMAPAAGNVSLMDGTTFATEAIYSCNAGFSLSGEARR